ncbi:MAG: RecX family transcriptional regulator [Bacilli bacterium]|nr:RecX family transcriptional regulator [Bacilli bacterium]
MKILKFQKKPNGKYRVFLDDGREFIYYEEVILQYNLLLTKEIKEEDLLTIHNTNLEYDVYYVALHSINSRFKSIYETREFLKKKEYPSDLIEKAIEKLIQQGYLNDRLFAKSYIHTQMAISSHGPIHIENELYQKKVDASIVSEEILVFDEELQKEKIKKIIEKELKRNHTRGGLVLKQKIIDGLKQQGYPYEVIIQVIGDYHFGNDIDLAKKEYEKLYKKYSRKYEGYELENKIREKMFQKGLVYEEE